jgi:hypothetical protein
VTTLPPKRLRSIAHPGEMFNHPYPVRICTHERGEFQSVRNSNVLIYWPHGFGDLVQLGYILPLLDSSNQYWVTRFGDDATSLMEGNDWITPIYLGESSTRAHEGEHYNNRNFGLDYKQIDGSIEKPSLPLPLYRACKQNRIDVILWSSFPEVFGRAVFPFHSKCRNLIPSLVREEARSQFRLCAPLKSSIGFEVPPWIARWVEARLASFGGFGSRKLCLISRNGYTSVGKNWGHLWREDMRQNRRREGEECRDFMRLMLRKNRRWMFLVMEDRLFSGDDTVRSPDLNCYSYAELFGSAGASSLPYGMLIKALLNFAELSVGVPTGPYHLSMAKTDLPTVGIWTEHMPSWYDEPKEASIHLISRNVRDQQADKRPGSFARQGELDFKLVWLDSRVITGAQVLSAVEQLLGRRTLSATLAVGAR